MDRAHELFKSRICDLPTLAYEYMNYFCSEVGLCGEAILTAFAYYAQEVEGLKCNDKNYLIDENGKSWFNKSKNETLR